MVARDAGEEGAVADSRIGRLGHRKYVEHLGTVWVEMAHVSDIIIMLKE